MQELLGFTATQSGWALMPRVLVMMVATPLVGRIYNLISPRLVIGFGVICFTIGAYQMSKFTLETSQWDIIKSILIQGIGFACLFVPLTTVALSTIPRPKLADATGLNSLLRQIGGSIGLAGFATILSNYAVDARASISAHVFAERPEIWQRLQMLQHGIQGTGVDAITSRGMAIGAIFGNVARQGMAMAFDKIFFLAGILFLIVLPLLLFLKAPDLNAPKAEVHLDM
jgi:DHA2 family multidrug resistance protein